MYTASPDQAYPCSYRMSLGQVDKLEYSTIGIVDKLFRCGSTAIRSLHGILKEYASFARATDERMNELASSCPVALFFFA